MADYEVEYKGDGKWKVNPSGGPVVAIVLVIMLLIGIFAQCDGVAQKKQKDQLRQEQTLNLAELELYSGSTGITIQDEWRWLGANAPDVKGGLFGGIDDCHASEKRKTYDGAYLSEYVTSYYGNYSNNNQTEACTILRNLNGEFSTFNAVLFLRKEDVVKWKDSENVNMQGRCFIFGDNRLLYQSPVLTPENPDTRFIEIDVSSVKELVIFIVGSAHMCNAYATR